MTGTLERLWGNNFKGDANEPDWKGTTYNYSGQIVSQRDIQRLVRGRRSVHSSVCHV